jgi:bacterioferritin
MRAATAYGLLNLKGMTTRTLAEDIKEIRRRARQHLGGRAVTQNYGGNSERTVAILTQAVATEIVCILRYKFHAACASGLASEAVKQEFTHRHAADEDVHQDLLTERVNPLGARPNMNPEGLPSHAPSEYVEGDDLVDVIRQNLNAERIAVETYREMVRYFCDKHPATRVMLEQILAKEEEHANEMHDLLASREGRPPLENNK